MPALLYQFLFFFRPFSILSILAEARITSCRIASLNRQETLSSVTRTVSILSLVCCLDIYTPLGNTIILQEHLQQAHTPLSSLPRKVTRLNGDAAHRMASETPPVCTRPLEEGTDGVYDKTALCSTPSLFPKVVLSSFISTVFSSRASTGNKRLTFEAVNGGLGTAPWTNMSCMDPLAVHSSLVVFLVFSKPAPTVCTVSAILT